MANKGNSGVMVLASGVVGAALGVVGALLLAPKKGAELRAEVRAKAGVVKERAMGFADGIKEMARNTTRATTDDSRKEDQHING